MDINLFGLSGLLIFITNVFLAVFVFAKGYKQKTNILWALEAMAVAVYGLGVFKVATTTDEETARLWWRVMHFGVILIPVFYYNFTYHFADLKRKLGLYAINVAGAFFVILNFTPHFIYEMRWVFDQFYYDSPSTLFYKLFVGFFLLVLLFSHYKLWKVYPTIQDSLKKTQIKYFVIGTFIGLLGGITAFLPVFGLDVYPLPNFTVMIYPGIIAYVIFAYRLFDVKTVASELLVISIWLFLLVRIFLTPNNEDRIVDIITLVIVVIVGIILIKSVLKEARQSEQLKKVTSELEDLTTNLQKKVDEQTRQLRNNYEEIKKSNQRLKKLTQQKSEFISLAAHELRTPLTSMRWITKAMHQGKLGKMNKGLQDASSKLNSIVKKMVEMVGEILSIINMEEGNYGFKKENLDFNELIDEIIEISKVHAQHKGINLINSTDENLGSVKIDKQKIKMAIGNILDNAINYTPEGGEVKFGAKADSGYIIITIADNGIGIPEKSKERMFEKFYRADNAIKKETEGTGLGLFISKNIISNHNGEVGFVSEEGKGTTFTIKLPST